jgi:hypothetical protein
MTTFLVSFAIIALAVAGMAIGVLVAGRRLQGSCGGLNAIEGLESACVVCTRPCARRRAAARRLASRQDSSAESRAG